MNYRILLSTGLLSLLIAISVFSISAQTAAFTYQGRLTDGANNAPTATYDIKFDLYDADVDGTLIGSVTLTSVFVNAGVFTVSLNFGQAAFDGTNRYLEMSIRPAGSAVARTMLMPRQRLTSSPYAVQSLKATTAVNFSGGLTGNVTGTQTATVVATVGGETAANVASGAQIANAATTANTPNTVVRRDGSGNFNAGIITAANLTLAPGGKVTFADGTMQQTSVDPALFVTRNVQSGSVFVTDTRLHVNIPVATSGEGLRVTVPSDNNSLLGGLIARFRSNQPLNNIMVDKFRFDQAGGFVALGNLGYGIIPATGEGVRLMWHPYKGSMRVGGASTAGEFDENNIGFYSFAGGNRTIANDFASFAFGDQVTVTGTSAVGFGGNNTVNGNNGFSSGSQNSCSGFVCTAIGFTAVANGQGAFALGYQTTASADYSFALGRYASTNNFAGAFVWGDASTTDPVLANAANQFTVRARGGIRLRTSTATGSNVGVNANTGCDIPGNSGVMSCASSRLVKENYFPLDRQDVLAKIRRLPVMQWSYIGDASGERHIGPFAEDFQSAFRLSPTDKSIGAQDLSGVALIGVQALADRAASLQSENDKMKTRIESLEDQLKRQEAAINELKKIVCAVNAAADICRQP